MLHLVDFITLLLWRACVASEELAGRSNLLTHLRSFNVLEFDTKHPYPIKGKRMLLHDDLLDGVDEDHPSSSTHPEKGELSFTTPQGRHWTLKFEKDYSFFAPTYSETHFHYTDDDSSVKPAQTTPRQWSHETHNCFYKGQVYQDSLPLPNSHVVLNSCSGGFSGVLWVGDDHYMIEPARFHLSLEQLRLKLGEQQHQNLQSSTAPDGQLHKFHLLFNADEVELPQWRCGVTWEDENGYLQRRIHQESGSGRHLLNILNHAHDHEGHEHTHEVHDSKNGRRLLGATQYVQLVVVNDYARFSKLGQDTETATAAIVQIINANYQRATQFTPTITVILSAQITFPYRDPPAILGVTAGTCSGCGTNEVGVGDLLSAFDDWRLSVNYEPASDNVHLFSGRKFESVVLGYAHVGTMCSPGGSSGINQMLSSLPAFNAAIVSHEMGHNFGMLHDSTNGNACPMSGFIMNAAVGAVPPTIFSDCSVAYFNDFMSTLTPDCTRNVPATQWGEPVCGNGFMDAGEQCDCGVDCAANPCCNSTSCQFVPGAVCSLGDPCCTESCQPASKNTTCRAAAGSCDVPETCDGTSGTCPGDDVAGPGTACSTEFGSGQCFQGSCMSLSRQCGEAGAKVVDGPYTGCSKQSYYNGGKFCGTLWCSKGNSVQCSYFKFAGPEVVVSDGVPCSTGKQCLGGSCVPSEELSAPSFTWVPTPWSSCTSCEQLQQRSLSCAKSAAGVTKAVDPRLCPATGQPSLSQKCMNATLGCIHYKTVFSASTIYIPFVKQTISRNIVIFTLLGLVILIMAMLAGCYKAVTYGATEAKLIKKGAKRPVPKLADEEG